MWEIAVTSMALVLIASAVLWKRRAAIPVPVAIDSRTRPGVSTRP